MKTEGKYIFILFQKVAGLCSIRVITVNLRFPSLSNAFVSVTAQPLPRKLLGSHYAINVI